MRKMQSLYESVDWEDSDSDPGAEEFSNTIELRKKFMYFKVVSSHIEILQRAQVFESEGDRAGRVQARQV